MVLFLSRSSTNDAFVLNYLGFFDATVELDEGTLLDLESALGTSLNRVRWELFWQERTLFQIGVAGLILCLMGGLLVVSVLRNKNARPG